MRNMLIPLGASLAVTAVTAFIGMRAVQNELTLRPPIAIIDYRPLAAALTAGVAARDVEPYLAELKRRAAAYQDAGYVVINAASIDAAPTDLFVPPPDDLPAEWQQAPATGPTAAAENPEAAIDSLDQERGPQ